ncbi:MAG: hypothetical protein JW940_30940, partial [Polyangiaceae bacterium]|nr:hypothetical protein [Polyangiaceae bacterium]
MSASNQPVKIDPEHFFDFISRPGPVVLFLSLHPAHPFNRALCGRLRDGQGDEVPVGSVGILELLLSASPALPFLHDGLLACGVTQLFHVLPGYYLFCAGQMLAWDSGLPIRQDVKAIARGSLLGAFVSAYTKNLSFLGMSLHFAADEAAADRLAARFGRAVADQRARPRPAAPPSSADEVLNAYQVLGVPPTATDDEVET